MSKDSTHDAVVAMNTERPKETHKQWVKRHNDEIEHRISRIYHHLFIAVNAIEKLNGRDSRRARAASDAYANLYLFRDDDIL